MHIKLGIYAALFITATITAAGTNAGSKKSLVGQQAPPFTLRMFDKSTHTLENYRGKVLVINYWATWCVPCKAEMPMMSGYHRKNQKRGFEIVGVITKDSVAPFRLKAVAQALSYPLATNLKGKYGVMEGVPTNYIIDKKGIVRYAKAGSFDDQEFAELIEPLLRE